MSKEKNPQIFIAKLSADVREKDLDYEFRRFGTIRNIQLKRGYAFIEYDDYKDAEDAIKEMDGRKFEGCRIVVQQASKIIFNHFKWVKEEIEREETIEEETTETISKGEEDLRQKTFALIVEKLVIGKLSLIYIYIFKSFLFLFCLYYNPNLSIKFF
jgi:hypothetical protein